MAAPRDNMDEEMMDIINTGTQFADGDQQDVDDGSQYLALEDNQENIVQENTGEVYIFIYTYLNIISIYIFEYLSSIMCTHDIYLFFFIRSPLDRRPQRRKAKIFEARKSHWRGAT